MKLFNRIPALATLSAAVVLFFAAPAKAQAGLFGIGRGTHLSANQQDTLRFSFLVSESSRGAVHGYWLFAGPTATFLVNVTSVMSRAPGEIAFAGEIVLISGTPPGGAVVGQTAFTAFRDNGCGATDETASFSVVPPQFGNPTIQQIAAMLPPPIYRPLATGNVIVR